MQDETTEVMRDPVGNAFRESLDAWNAKWKEFCGQFPDYDWTDEDIVNGCNDCGYRPLSPDLTLQETVENWDKMKSRRGETLTVAVFGPRPEQSHYPNTDLMLHNRNKMLRQREFGNKRTVRNRVAGSQPEPTGAPDELQAPRELDLFDPVPAETSGVVEAPRTSSPPPEIETEGPPTEPPDPTFTDPFADLFADLVLAPPPASDDTVVTFNVEAPRTTLPPPEFETEGHEPAEHDTLADPAFALPTNDDTQVTNGAFWPTPGVLDKVEDLPAVARRDPPEPGIGEEPRQMRSTVLTLKPTSSPVAPAPEEEIIAEQPAPSAVVYPTPVPKAPDAPPEDNTPTTHGGYEATPSAGEVPTVPMRPFPIAVVLGTIGFIAVVLAGGITLRRHSPTNPPSVRVAVRAPVPAIAVTPVVPVPTGTCITVEGFTNLATGEQANFFGCRPRRDEPPMFHCRITEAPVVATRGEFCRGVRRSCTPPLGTTASGEQQIACLAAPQARPLNHTTP